MKKLLSDTKLKQELTILANRLNSKCEEVGGGITFICVLKGGFMFFSDLVKLIKYPIKIDFIQCKSYNDMERGDIKIIQDITSDIQDHTVFIIDDILDSGETMKFLYKHFTLLGAQSVKTVSAIYKENVDFPNHLYIYKQPEGVNPWYVGYGMDDKGYNRNLNSINTI